MTATAYVGRWREIYMKLQMVNVTRKFGDFRAVENLNLTIENGVYGLLGVNGAGKTTLMRMICTLLPPTSGQILCDGKDIFKMDGEYRNLLGYLPQEFGFYPDFTVKDYLLYIASLKGIRPMVAGKRVKDLLAQVGLTKSANKKMKKLSGGMKRRAGIAQAMLNNPKILILDEPTAGLDPTERVRFRNLISELSEDRIVILSTHIVSDVEAVIDDKYDMFDLFAATFTAGTMTGAPKIRAMELIAQFEGIKRNFYSGSIAYFGFDGNMDSAITIRTTMLTHDTVIFQAGAGVVADSNPEDEYLEVTNKLAANIATLKDLS